MAKKKKCNCKKEPFIQGTYYHQGESSAAEIQMMCELVMKGHKVYHQFGKPGNNCGGPGQPPCH